MRLKILLVSLIIVIALPFSVFAQEDLTETYTADWITFNHPAGWVVSGSYPQLEGANSEAALGVEPDALAAGQFQFSFVDGLVLSQLVGYEAGAPLPVILTGIKDLILSDTADPATLQPPVDVTSGTYPLQYIVGTDSNSEALIGVVEVSPGQVLFFSGSGGIGEVEAFLPTLLAMVDSIQYDAASAQAAFDGAGSGAAGTPEPLAPVLGSIIWQQQAVVGFEEGQFGTFSDLAVAPDDTIYVADAYYGILVFDADGNRLDNIANEEIFNITDVALAEDGTLWVIDQFSQTMYHIDTEGNMLSSFFGEIGTEAGQFGDFSPLAIEIGTDGNLYLLDTKTDASGNPVASVLVFTPDGTFERAITLSDEFGNFTDPDDMTFGADGNLYFADVLSGILIVNATDGSIVDPDFAQALTDVIAPSAIAVAPDGRVAVGETGTIYLIDPSGKPIAEFGTEQALSADGSPIEFEAGTFYLPSGIEFLSNGDLIVADGNFTFSQLVRVHLGE